MSTQEEQSDLFDNFYNKSDIKNLASHVDGGPSAAFTTLCDKDSQSENGTQSTSQGPVTFYRQLPLQTGFDMPAGTSIESLNAFQSLNVNRKRPLSPPPVLIESLQNGFLEPQEDLMKPAELESMEKFFQRALTEDPTTLSNEELFNETEQQFFSNFLDGFLDAEGSESAANQPEPLFLSSFNSGRLPIDQNGQNVSNQQLLSQYNSGYSTPQIVVSNLYKPVPQRIPQSFLELSVEQNSFNPLTYSSYESTLYQNQSSARSSVAGALDLSLSMHQQVKLPHQSLVQQPKLDTSISGDPSQPKVVLAPRKKRHASKQLLSETEKRQNHVLSEQKRRQNIKLGFDALLKIVPSLSGMSMKDEDDASVAAKTKNPAPAKTLILTEAIDYLHHLLQRNERLQARANQLRRLLASDQRV